MRFKSLFIVAVAVLIVGSLFGQQVSASGTALAIKPDLPKVYLRQPLRIQLAASGGTTPYRWQMASGTLPSGVSLERDGALSGTPTQTGSFRFTVTLTDRSEPALQLSRQLDLRVVAPLLLQWSKPPKVTGRRIEGSVTVANGTDHDFDLTVVMVAVNETGRATALGYQHLQMKKDSPALDVPFGENLPKGTYQLNVDAVAEAETTNSIYRSRLVEDAMRVDQGP